VAVLQHSQFVCDALSFVKMDEVISTEELRKRCFTDRDLACDRPGVSGTILAECSVPVIASV